MTATLGGCTIYLPADRGVASGPLTPAVADASDDAIAAALTFDPPIAMRQAPPDLSREPRERTAFLGFNEDSTTFTHVRVYDRQTVGDRHDDLYERRAISERFGTSSR